MGKNMKNDKKARNQAALKAMQEKQSRKRREQRKKERKQKQQEKGKAVKTKQEERKEFISSLGKVECYGQRVDAQIAEQKRKEEYLKYVKYSPKLEQKVYCSKESEGKGEI